MAFVRSSGTAQTTEASDAMNLLCWSSVRSRLIRLRGRPPHARARVGPRPTILAKNDRFDAIAILPAPALANSSQHVGRCAKFAD